jgi:DNA-binding NtrC family response regulator
VLLESARLKIRTDRLEDAVVLLRKAERLLGKDPGGPDAEEVRSLRRTIEERFAEGSLSPVNNRFLAFRESIRDGSSPLPRLVRELGADRAFIFHRVQAGESVVGECHLFSPLDAVRVLRSLDARIAASGGLRPFVSVGGGSGGTRAFLVAPFGDGEAGVYVERKLDPATRPFARSDLDFLVGVGCEVDSLARSQGARAPIAGRDGAFEGVVTRNKRMIEILAMLRRLGGVHTTVLLQGETGTGKGLLASEISRADAAPFVTINCADLTETILESELFGHAKNAFTGAGSGKKGLFEVANGGTVFIDEIDKTSRKFQEKLLRVVDRREFKPVGSVDLKRVECRIVCASNRDLRAEVDAGRFLEDLYYRLKVISIQIPPLRERPEDIPLLADHFLKKSSRAMRREGVAFAPEVVRLFTRYTWPGNVRDIQNEVERAVALASDGETIGVSSLSDELVAFERSGVPPRADGEGTLAHMVEGLEERAIRDALLRFAGNKSRAARSLGLTRKGLRNKILRYGIDS